MLAKFKEKLRDLYTQLNTASGGVLGILRKTLQSFGETQASQAAASLAYYTFFSLFPLLLVLASVTSSILRDEQAHQEAIAFVQQAFPISQGLIERNVQRVLELRGTVGLVGLVGLLWSASGVFNTLAYNINMAWSRAEARGFLERRFVALMMIVALFGLLLLSLTSTTLANLLPRLALPLDNGTSIYDTLLWALGSRLVPWLFTFLMFLALYRWVPNTDVPWWSAFWGALVAAIAWEGGKAGFAWYLSSGLVAYELVYGSLGAVVALLFWIYLSSMITLFGAHLSAAVAKQLASH
jgi:membrane protein